MYSCSKPLSAKGSGSEGWSECWSEFFWELHASAVVLEANIQGNQELYSFYIAMSGILIS